MEQATQESIEAIIQKDTWTVEDHHELLEVLFNTQDAPRKFRAQVAAMEAREPEPRGAAALKIGIARYMLCRFQDALAVLGEATDNRDRRYFQGLCYKNLREYDKAAEDFSRAAERGFDALQIDMELIETQALSGDTDAARKALGKIESKAGESAVYHYLRGLIDELAGQVASADEAYEQARQIDPSHTQATFRLAYLRDLHGDEEEALDLYRQCAATPPVHANALINMAVLYEDAGRYDQAIICLKRILATNPNHPRARMFLQDAEASKNMYYDEDQAKRIARRNAVLDIPISDFELSVRARNCLKKMNVNTLGDLARISEPELLAYKNFGETSLKEIKDMLASRNLRLGQALEDEDDQDAAGQPSDAMKDAMEIPIDQVDFSIRARKALENLGVKSLGNLAAKTEAELLACKNFGQTSLNEINQRLGEHGLKLREPG